MHGRLHQGVDTQRRTLIEHSMREVGTGGGMAPEGCLCAAAGEYLAS